MRINPSIYWSILAGVLLVAVVLLVLEEQRKPTRQKPTVQQNDTTTKTTRQASKNERLTPLSNSPAIPARTLPDNTIVLNMTDAESVKAPFALEVDVSSPIGTILDLPEGAGTSRATGAATFPFETPSKGMYHIWTRARWDNSCGNSVSIRIDDGPRRALGQDSVYNIWHWVKVRKSEQLSGRHLLTLGEREDGIAIDQILLTQDPSFVPTGPVSTKTASIGIRRFADDFARSPGHGMEAWNLRSGDWKIEFTLDPNRIPNQYSLTGSTKDGKPAIALVRGQPWEGAIISFNAYISAANQIGAVLDMAEDGDSGLRITVQTQADKPCLIISGQDIKTSKNVDDFVRTGQWHHFTIERWANVLRVSIDDQRVFSTYDLAPKIGGLGLLVEKGGGIFDDFEAEDAPWQADAPGGPRIPWKVAEQTQWFRPTGEKEGVALVGRAGSISTQLADLPVAEAVVLGPGASNCSAGECFTASDESKNLRVFTAKTPETTFSISTDAEAELKRVAVRYGAAVPEVFRLGPYHFSKLKIRDPSDYMDFTPEEWAETKKSANKSLLKRGNRGHVVVGKIGGRLTTVWQPESGRWILRDKALLGTGPHGRIRLWRDINSDIEAVLRVKRTSPDAITDLVLYAGKGESCARIRLGNRDDLPKENLLVFADAKPNEWHTLRVRVSDGILSACLDHGDWQKRPFIKGIGGGICLDVHSGAVWYDDIEFLVRRKSKRESFYAFDRRETDWWHVGGKWRNHGGISCVLASNWITLDAPKGIGILWNKRAVKSDLLVAFNVEEASHWFGWKKRPTHIHYPYDNIQIFLSTEEDEDEGYRLEVNSRNRTATVLYRNGVEAANVDQRKHDFPIRYVHGHEPYEPRRNRITLAKRGGLIRVIINRKEVLRYTDPDPLPVSKVGVGGYHTHFNLSNVEICELPAK